MAQKGSNSILFDIDSIIDIEGSVIKVCRDTYLQLPDNSEEKENMKDSYNIEVLEKLTDNDIKQARMIRLNPFKLLLSKKYKDNWKYIMDTIYESDKKEILNEFAILTDMVTLIKAYHTAGNGIVSSTIRIDPDDEITKEYIENTLPAVPLLISKREDVDLDNYGRIVTGSTKSMLQYKINTPKSLLILDYRDNYTVDDSKVLDPELIIKLGDVNEIRISLPYRIQ